MKNKKNCFMTIVKELREAIDLGLLQKDINNENNIIVYRTKGYHNKEGWHSQNILDIATELSQNEENYENFKKEIELAKNKKED